MRDGWNTVETMVGVDADTDKMVFFNDSERDEFYTRFLKDGVL